MGKRVHLNGPSNVQGRRPDPLANAQGQNDKLEAWVPGTPAMEDGQAMMEDMKGRRMNEIGVVLSLGTRCARGSKEGHASRVSIERCSRERTKVSPMFSAVADIDGWLKPQQAEHLPLDRHSLPSRGRQMALGRVIADVADAT